MKSKIEHIRIVSISLPNKLVQKIDYHREDTPRSKFVQRLLEKGFEFGNELRPNSNLQQNIGKTVQTSSGHKLTDVKQTDLRKVGRNNTVEIKSEIEATCNSPIPCLKREFLANDL